MEKIHERLRQSDVQQKPRRVVIERSATPQAENCMAERNMLTDALLVYARADSFSSVASAFVGEV